MRLSFLRLSCVLCAVTLTPLLDAEIPPHLGRADSPFYTDHRQSDFPFFETTLDVRNVAPRGNQDNLSPRAVVFRAAENFYVGFDTELLRIIVIWEGDGVTANSMSDLSYAKPLAKLGGGIDKLPRPEGRIIAATGLYPGWQQPDRADFSDPRYRGADPAELGRGPLVEPQGRWRGVTDSGDFATAHYSMGTAEVRETFEVSESSGQTIFARHLEITDLKSSIDCVVAELDRPTNRVPAYLRATGAGLRIVNSRYVVATIKPNTAAQSVSIFYESHRRALPQKLSPIARRAASPINRAANQAKTQMIPGAAQGSYAVDELLIPYPNPWQRRIRPTDIGFDDEGTAYVVTFDGDVFSIQGMDSADSKPVSVRRIASGFFDPQSILVRRKEVFVLSRLGLTRLVDQDEDGDTDFYELVSNAWVQSPETRSFPHSIVAMPDDSFLISVGGQQGSHRTPHAGRVIQLSPTGEFQRIFADGLRNGFVSRLGDTDRLVASDQQGQWVPATPMHHIQADKFYGYEPGTADSRSPEPAPIWIPHRYAQSGIDLLAINDARSGNLFGGVLMVDYYKPSLINILGTDAEPFVQAAAVPLPVLLEVPILKGEMNPADGQSYFVGMQIWGSNGPRIEGVSRIRALQQTDDLPFAATAHNEGVWLQFREPLSTDTASDPSSYAATSWSYRRTENYGSGQYRADGEAGVDQWPIHSVHLNADRTAVFLAIPDMALTQQLEIRYRRSGGIWQEVFFTLNQITPATADQRSAVRIDDFDTVFAAPPATRSAPMGPPAVSIERGEKLFTTFGCVGCHSITPSDEEKPGPSLHAIAGTQRPLAGDRQRRASDNYLLESIINPATDLVLGFEKQDVAMPSFNGVLSPNDIAALILYIKSLK